MVFCVTLVWSRAAEVQFGQRSCSRKEAQYISKGAPAALRGTLQAVQLINHIAKHRHASTGSADSISQYLLSDCTGLMYTTQRRLWPWPTPEAQVWQDKLTTIKWALFVTNWTVRCKQQTPLHHELIVKLMWLVASQATGVCSFCRCATSTAWSWVLRKLHKAVTFPKATFL